MAYVNTEEKERQSPYSLISKNHLTFIEICPRFSHKTISLKRQKFCFTHKPLPLYSTPLLGYLKCDIERTYFSLNNIRRGTLERSVSFDSLYWDSDETLISVSTRSIVNKFSKDPQSSIKKNKIKGLDRNTSPLSSLSNYYSDNSVSSPDNDLQSEKSLPKDYYYCVTYQSNHGGYDHSPLSRRCFSLPELQNSTNRIFKTSKHHVTPSTSTDISQIDKCKGEKGNDEIDDILNERENAVQDQVQPIKTNLDIIKEQLPSSEGMKMDDFCAEVISSSEESTQPQALALTSEVYLEFRDQLTRLGIPTYLISTSVEEGIDKICIDVKEGYLAKATAYFSNTFEELHSQNMLDIMEQGEIMFGHDLAAEIDLPKDPGETYSQIEPGIKLYAICGKHLDNNQSIQNADSSVTVTGTLGAIVQDEEGKLYGLTAKHIFGKLFSPNEVLNLTYCRGFERGIGFHSFCYLVRNSHSQPYHIGDSYYGVFFPQFTVNTSDAETNPNKYKHCEIVETRTMSMVPSLIKSAERSAIDVAAIPLLLSCEQNNLIKYQRENSNGNVDLEVFQGNIKDMLDRTVQAKGAVSGLSKGTIYPKLHNDFYDEGGWLGSDCFIVTTDTDVSFMQLGDSGSLVTDITDNVTKGYAYGIFISLQKGWKSRKNPRETKTASWCVMLSTQLNAIKNKWGLNLDLPHPVKKRYIFQRTRPISLLSVSNDSLFSDGLRTNSNASSGLSLQLRHSPFSMHSLCGHSDDNENFPSQVTRNRTQSTNLDRKISSNRSNISRHLSLMQLDRDSDYLSSSSIDDNMR